ncbi:amino acid ABC transporter permease [Peptoniphilus sp. GNH]|nr:putative glutamine ABC transporter, permease protein GlnP [Clostridiales bacterium KA00134]UHR02376.1 amino acid ABC transporter permease [Peptoniphilus sp. GNH]
MLEKMLEIWQNNYPLFINGTILTLQISLIGTILGLLIGLGIGIIRTLPKKSGMSGLVQKLINAILSFYILFFRGTPMMVQSMVIYFGIPLFFDVRLPLVPAAFFIVSINTGAYMSEVVRGGILSIDKGQFEAAYASGMTHFQTMLYVILPQTLRNILPATGNEFVINVKDTSVLNVIGVSELFFQSRSIAGANFNYFGTFFVTCIIYLILTTIITNVLRFAEKKMDGPKDFELKSGNQMQV